MTRSPALFMRAGPYGGQASGRERGQQRIVPHPDDERDIDNVPDQPVQGEQHVGEQHDHVGQHADVDELHRTEDIGSIRRCKVAGV